MEVLVFDSVQAAASESGHYEFLQDSLQPDGKSELT
jgi:hypothetical protein